MYGGRLKIKKLLIKKNQKKQKKNEKKIKIFISGKSFHTYYNYR